MTTFSSLAKSLAFVYKDNFYQNEKPSTTFMAASSNFGQSNCTDAVRLDWSAMSEIFVEFNILSTFLFRSLICRSNRIEVEVIRFRNTDFQVDLNFWLLQMIVTEMMSQSEIKSNKKLLFKHPQTSNQAIFHTIELLLVLVNLGSWCMY